MSNYGLALLAWPQTRKNRQKRNLPNGVQQKSDEWRINVI